MDPPTKARLALAEQFAEITLIDAEIISPPVPARDVLSRYATIIIFEKPTKKGFCIRTAEQYLVYFNKRYDSFNLEWTYAHELGHIMMGHTVYSQAHLSPEQVEVARIEAEHFAACLMMPQQWLRTCIKQNGLKSFHDLRRYVQLFGVPWSRMERRLIGLGLSTRKYLNGL